MFAEFVSLATQYGWQGVLFALVVLALVYFARINGLVVDGNGARIANVVLSAILTGLNPLDPSAPDAIVAVIASLGSALLYELIRWANSRLNPAK